MPDQRALPSRAPAHLVGGDLKRSVVGSRGHFYQFMARLVAEMGHIHRRH